MIFLLFCLKLFLFIVLGGVAFFAILSRFIFKDDKDRIECFLYSIGLGPALASLLLYYLLLIFPHLHSLFYLGTICAFFIGMIAFNKKSVTVFYRTGRGILRKTKPLLVRQKKLADYLFSNNNAAMIVMIFVFVLGIRNVFLLDLPGHDFLEYLIQGDYHFMNRSIDYTSHIYNTETGFYYVGLHGWSFPLQVTLEKLVDSVTLYGFDLYSRFLTLWYGILLLTIIYYLGKRYIGAVYATLIISLLCLSKGYLGSVIYFHIDSYRIFFFSLSIIFMLRQIEKPSWETLPLLGFIIGTSGFSHSLGIILSVATGATLFLFIQKGWLYRIKYVVSFTICVLIFGGVHYILDIFYGTGWLFKEIDFY